MQTTIIIIAILLTIAVSAGILAYAIHRRRRQDEAEREQQAETDQQAQRPIWRPE